MKIPFLIIIILTLSGCSNPIEKEDQQTKSSEASKRLDSAQVEPLNDTFAIFSSFWKTDSLGRNGFRKHSYDFDKHSKSWRINKLALKGYSKNKIVSLLGPPNGSGLGKEDSLLIMEYVVDYNFGKKTKTLLLYFDAANNLNDIILETGI